MSIEAIRIIMTVLIVYSVIVTLGFLGLMHLDTTAFELMLLDIFGLDYEEEKDVLRERFEWHRSHYGRG